MSIDSTSHYALSASNFLAGFLTHDLDGRHLIDFKHQRTGIFLPWCEIWADGIQFKCLQYRKSHKSVRHQFVCLRDFRRNPDVLLPEDDSEKANLWKSLGTGLETRICTVERMADPDAQVNAIVRASAVDYINFFPEGSESEKKELDNTSILLEIIFPEYVDLSHVLDICYRISRHPKACDYTLQQFNCYFFCWNIILGLLRPQAKWDVALSEQYEVIVRQAVDDWLQDLVATESSTNLALVVSSTITSRTSSSNLSPSLSETISECFHSRTSLRDFQKAIRSALWTSEQEGALRGVISQILNEVTDRTTGLVSNGTGERSIEDLFRRDPVLNPLDAPQDWQEDIQREDHRAFNTFVNSVMWPVFEAALESKGKAASRDEARSKLSAAQKLRYSEPALKARLSSLGYKTAWRNASAATADDNTPLRLLNTVLQMPRQLHNVSKISGPFVSIVAAELEQRAANNNPLKIEGDGSHLLQLMTNMEGVDYSGLEAQVVSQIEWSIRNMAQNHPGCDSGTLKLATLQLLMRLRKRGEDIKFYVDPRLTWRVCLWYSLGGGITKSLAEVVQNRCASSEPKYECRQLVTVSAKKFLVLKRCQLSYSQIETFVLGRVKRLSEKLRKDELGSVEQWQKEIETVMSAIWNDKRTWRDALVHLVSSL
ncbi:hypothetical protein FRC12_000271 [Ceratobasidium sp. 428]|nr:hypothetical protein FRC12_000271 [Ceratobasidium sp. 428]